MRIFESAVDGVLVRRSRMDRIGSFSISTTPIVADSIVLIKAGSA
jgi:hypothetical protein